MFFIMGINSGQKELGFRQLMTCRVCGAYGSYSVFMTYTVLSLFFLPVFKWNRKYFVRTSCCNAIYQLDPGVGKQIAAGKEIEIQPWQLSPVEGFAWRQQRRCSNCGYTTAEDFEYCPKCGQRF